MRRVSEDPQDEHRYDDILSLPHPVSKNHRQMPQIDRAAQFAPFAALTGYEESIQGALKKPEERMELSETQIDELNRQLSLLRENLAAHPVIAICYYYQETEKEHMHVLRKKGQEKDIAETKQMILQAKEEDQIRKSAKGEITVNGYYRTERKQVRRIDEQHHILIFNDHSCIHFEDILAINSDLIEPEENATLQ
jgi:hypothetical protein